MAVACAEGLIALLPTSDVQLRAMQEAGGQGPLSAPDMGARLAVSGPSTVLHPNPTHEQQGITLLEQVHVTKGL